MRTAAQIRATRALLGKDQRALAEASGLQLINEGAPSQGGGRGVRLQT